MLTSKIISPHCNIASFSNSFSFIRASWLIKPSSCQKDPLDSNDTGSTNLLLLLIRSPVHVLWFFKHSNILFSQFIVSREKQMFQVYAYDTCFSLLHMCYRMFMQTLDQKLGMQIEHGQYLHAKSPFYSNFLFRASSINKLCIWQICTLIGNQTTLYTTQITCTYVILWWLNRNLDRLDLG